MADKTTGALPAVKEAEIGQLPGIEALYDNTLIPVEQQGEARHMTGAQFKNYAKQSAAAGSNSAQAAAEEAKQAAESIKNMTVEAQTLPPGYQASVQKTLSGGVVNLLFGIPKGIDGASFVVTGRYDTLSQLQAAHPTGKPGEAYAVGTPDNNIVYIWDTDKSAWVPIGKIQGPPGAIGPVGPAGKDAYEIAVEEQGFTGTRQEWLDSLKGEGGGGPVTLPDNLVITDGGGELIMPGVIGGGPVDVIFTEEEDNTGGGGSGDGIDLSAYAPKASPKFTGSISLGRVGSASVGINSAAFGYLLEASGMYSAAFGNKTNATGYSAHSEGDMTTASGSAAHSEGETTEANGRGAHSEGYGTVADGDYSHSGGYFTNSDTLQYAIGAYNVITTDGSTASGNRLVIGNGTASYARSNAFRVHSSGDVYGGLYHSSGADYAEVFEWTDGNPDWEDRVGRFVVLDGENIRLATSEDDSDNILGIVSAAPSIVGDSHDDQWRGMYQRDIFGRLLIGENGAPIPNPEYNPEKTYAPQSERSEKDAVGLLGKLVAVDDGSVRVNGWCTSGNGGIAVASDVRTRFRCMSRLDDTHIRILIL